VQHNRDLADQHVTDHATADPGDHPDGARADDAKAVLQAQPGGSHGEEAEPGGVQHEVGPAQSLDLRMHPERDQPGDAGHRDVGPVPQCERWRQAEQQVAQHSPAQGGDSGEHGHAEQVEPRADPGQPAREPKTKTPTRSGMSTCSGSADTLGRVTVHGGLSSDGFPAE